MLLEEIETIGGTGCYKERKMRTSEFAQGRRSGGCRGSEAKEGGREACSNLITHRCRGGMLIRFHPESRASSDQDPGPVSASAVMRMHRKILRLASQRCEYAPNSSKAATVTHVVRVQKPNKRTTPTKITTKRAVMSSKLQTTGACKQLKAKPLAMANRRRNNPMLGRTSAKLV